MVLEGKQIHPRHVIIVAGLVALAALGLGWRLYQKAHAIKRLVTFYRGTQPSAFETTASTVEAAIAEAGIALKPHDVVAPDLSAPVSEGLEIDLGLVERRVQDFKKPVRYNTHTQYTDTLNIGEIIDIETGKDGLKEGQTETYLLNGVEAFEKTLKSTVLEPSKDAKVLEGTALKQKLYPLKKRMRVSKILTMQATAYYPGPEDTWPYASGYTSSGLKAGYGVVAVDPKVVRLKNHLYIEDYGYAIAADKGAAIKGNKIDLCFDTYEEAVRFGRKNVKVYILR
jgi:3D (Asp-Asp-Asp) domain-containing protein